MIKTKVKEIKQIAGEAIVSPNLEKEFKHEYEIIRALLNFSNRELYPGYDDKMSKLWSKKDVKLETEEI